MRKPSSSHWARGRGWVRWAVKWRHARRLDQSRKSRCWRKSGPRCNMRFRKVLLGACWLGSLTDCDGQRSGSTRDDQGVGLACKPIWPSSSRPWTDQDLPGQPSPQASGLCWALRLWIAAQARTSPHQVFGPGPTY